MKRIKAVLAVVALVLVFGIAGRIDYTEEVVYHMSKEDYDRVKDTLGNDASDYEIAKYYMNEKNKDKEE